MKRGGRSGTFFTLFAALLLLLLVYPVLAERNLSAAVLTIFHDAVLLAALYAVSDNKRRLVIGLTLCIPAFAGTWFVKFIADSPAIGAPAVLFLAAFYAFITVHMMRVVLQRAAVTLDTMFAALSVYLLIGLTFSFFHLVLHGLSPGAYSVGDLASHKGAWPDFVYFSFVTLTTLGYGDILPLTGFARALSALEAVTGVIYMAVVISRLVSDYVSRGHAESK